MDQANPTGELCVLADHLDRHTSSPIQAGPATRPPGHPVCTPRGAYWLSLQEAWWRLLRREALAGQTFAHAAHVDLATQVATDQLNRRAKPWIY